MERSRFRNFLWTLIIATVLGVAFGASGRTVVLAQEPTASATPGAESTSGMFITVISSEPQINVRGGPGSVAYPIVGFLLQGATAPALGRSPGGDWIQISYPGAPGGVGWVYSPLVLVSPGALRVIEPPPTPVPPATNTIDPTLAAQFDAVPSSTRLPTFTPPSASLAAPDFSEAPSANNGAGFPLGLAILAFASVGSIGFLISLVVRR